MAKRKRLSKENRVLRQAIEKASDKVKILDREIKKLLER